MNTLYLRIPAKHVPAWSTLAVAFAVCTQEGLIVREGRSVLTDLAELIANTDVVLLIAAADVSLMQLSVPPMQEAKLKQALPTLVEDRLLGDIADNVLILAPKSTSGAVGLINSTTLRTIAVAERSWLQELAKKLFSLGAKHLKALPAQLCLPLSEGRMTVRLAEAQQDYCANMAVRLEEESGMGVLLDDEDDLTQRLTSALMLLPAKPVLLLLPSELVPAYQEIIAGNSAWSERIVIQASNWLMTAKAAKAVSVNLMAGLNNAQTNRLQWQTWRWPLVLGTLVLVVNMIGLNSDYWSLKREAQALKQNMIQTYKLSFPKESVILFPLEQMKKNVAIALRNSGQASPDDFTLLLTQFGSAWQSLAGTQLPKIVSIEYKDHGLLIQIKGEMPQQQLQATLTGKGLTLKKNNAEVWQVRSVK